MLPFLKKPKSTGIAMEYRKPDVSSESHDDSDHGLDMASEDLCKAVSSGDYKAAARALRAAFEILDSQPHEEAPHLNEEE